MADEYIKREDAFTVLTEYYHHRADIQNEALREALTRVPAADVRPVVRGLWKRVDPRSTVVTFRCSECNYYAHVNATNFCPNCGADMRAPRDIPGGVR